MSFLLNEVLIKPRKEKLNARRELSSLRAVIERNRVRSFKKELPTATLKNRFAPSPISKI